MKQLHKLSEPWIHSPHPVRAFMSSLPHLVLLLTIKCWRCSFPGWGAAEHLFSVMGNLNTCLSRRQKTELRKSALKEMGKDLDAIQWVSTNLYLACAQTQWISCPLYFRCCWSVLNQLWQTTHGLKSQSLVILLLFYHFKMQNPQWDQFLSLTRIKTQINCNFSSFLWETLNHNNSVLTALVHCHSE